MSSFRKKHLLPAVAVMGIASFVLTGCVDGEATTTDDAQGGTSENSALYQAALDKATEIVGGEEIGGTVTLMGTWGGEERERFLSTLAPFEEATGVTIDFTGTEDYESIQQSSIAGGTPIDVVAAGNLGTVLEYAGEEAVDLNTLVGEDTLSESYAQGFLDSTTVDGGNYGIWTMVDNYMIWYNPNNYDGPTGDDVTWDQLSDYTTELSDSGTAPWCMGLSAGASTGWPGAYFLMNLLLKQSGPEFMTALSNGEASWDSPEVRSAFALFEEVVASEETVLGGPSGVITTDPGAASAGMYSDPQQCSLEHWGTFTASIILASDPTLEAGTDLDFMKMPTIDPAYASSQGYGGTVMTAFSDRPEVAAFMKYEASVEAASLVAATGNWTGANQNISADSYPNEILGRVSSDLLGASDLVPFPLALTPSSVTSAIYASVAEFVQDPSTLDASLTTIDAAVAATN